MARQGRGRSPRQGRGRGLAAWDGFGLFRGIQIRLCLSVLFCGSLLPISATLWGAPMLCAFGTSGPRFSAPTCASLGVMERGGGGGRASLGGFGASRACGQGSACGAAGEWAGPTAGERVGARGRGWVRDFSGNSTRLRLAAFLCRASRQIPAALSSASLLCLTAHPSRPFGGSLPFGPGKVAVVRGGGVSGVALGVGASRARGQGNACSVALEWAGPTAGEGVGARGIWWVQDFSVI